MSAAGEQFRAILTEADAIAREHFGAETVENIPLLVTNIALGIVQLEAGATPPAAPKLDTDL